MTKVDAILATVGVVIYAVLALNGFSVDAFLYRLHLLLIVG